MGDDMVLEIMDREGTWEYVNDYLAAIYSRKRSWFVGKNMFEEFSELREHWAEIICTVADTRETYIDRGFRGLPHLPRKGTRWTWNVLVFPIKLHDDRDGALLSARLIERK